VYLYDLTSTYFEGQAQGNPQAKRGYSRDKRPDCKQVVVGLVLRVLRGASFDRVLAIVCG
jgi:transposase